MLVLWKNRIWSIDMSYNLFKMLSKKRPQDEVEIMDITQSNYKELKKVPISELNNDYIEASSN